MSSTINSYLGNLHSEGYIALHSQEENPTTDSEHGVLFAKEEGGTTRLFAMDGDGNITQLSPHNAQGDWVFYSHNTKTGQTVRINMSRVIRSLELLTGETFIEEE